MERRNKKSNIRQRAKSVHETRKKVRFEVDLKSSSKSSSEESILTVHLEPQSISTNSITNFVTNSFLDSPPNSPPKQESKPRSKPKRRMTTEVQNLMKFQQNLHMTLDPEAKRCRKRPEFKTEEAKGPKGAKSGKPKPIKKRRYTTASVVTEKPVKFEIAAPTKKPKHNLKSAEKSTKTRTETEKTTNSELNQRTHQVLSVDSPSVEIHLNLPSQVQMISYKKQGSIQEALLSLQTGFAMVTGSPKVATGISTDNDSYTMYLFPQSFKYRQLNEHNPQHYMLQLSGGEELSRTVPPKSNLTILVISGSVVVEIIRKSNVQEKLKLTTLSSIKLKPKIHYSLKNETAFEAILFFSS